MDVSVVRAHVGDVEARCSLFFRTSFAPGGVVVVFWEWVMEEANHDVLQRFGLFVVAMSAEVADGVSCSCEGGDA